MIKREKEVSLLEVKLIKKRWVEELNPLLILNLINFSIQMKLNKLNRSKRLDKNQPILTLLQFSKNLSKNLMKVYKKYNKNLLILLMKSLNISFLGRKQLNSY